jgi:hypothetical protein
MVRKSARRSSSQDLPDLSRLEQQVLSHLLTAIELGNYDETAPSDDLAKAFGRNPKPFKRVINQLVRKGYATVSGGMLEMVYPTVAALRNQNPDLSPSHAERVLKKLGALKRGRTRNR